MPVAVQTLSVAGTVVCLATGPSLRVQDVAAVRGKATVIAVNDAHRLAPWADVLYSSDKYWWQHHYGVPTFKGLKFAIESCEGRGRRDYVRWPEIGVLRRTGDYGIERERDGLRTCFGNSGGAAINLAVHLGARRVILIGYDVGREGTRTHFFGEHPRPLRWEPPFAAWLDAFARMTDDLERLGVQVLNCSRRTALSAFQIRSLEDVLVSLGEKAHGRASDAA